jgi:hypothetical protein
MWTSALLTIICIAKVTATAECKKGNKNSLFEDYGKILKKAYNNTKRIYNYT